MAKGELERGKERGRLEQGPAGEGTERWIVDGLEDSPRGRLARVELPSGRTRTLPVGELPEGVREGDWLEVCEGPDGLWIRRLVQETEQARAQAQAELDRLNSEPEGPQQEVTL